MTGWLAWPWAPPAFENGLRRLLLHQDRHAPLSRFGGSVNGFRPPGATPHTRRMTHRSVRAGKIEFCVTFDWFF